jgi:hypothetical protein
MRRALPVVLLLVSLQAGPVAARDLFSSGRLFVAKAMKESGSSRFLSVGTTFQFAPVKALARQAVQQIEDQSPEARLVFDTLRSVPPEQVDAMANAAEEGGTALKAFIATTVPGLDAAIDQSTPQELSGAAELARIAADPEEATSFIFEPFVEVNTDWVSVELAVPLAGFATTSASSTEFALGNLTLDTKFGWIAGDDIGYGISGGLEASFPTGRSARINTLALANIFSGPKFLKNYLSFAPYLVTGVDVWLFNFQGYLKLVQMFAMGSGTELGNATYLQYGAVAALAPWRFLNVMAEINGAADLFEAEPFDAVYLTLGLKFALWFLRPGVAVHVPLFQQAPAVYSGFGSGTFGSPADWSVIASLSFDF